jgi:hypothetical protein
MAPFFDPVRLSSSGLNHETYFVQTPPAYQDDTSLIFYTPTTLSSSTAENLQLQHFEMKAKRKVAQCYPLLPKGQLAPLS